MESWSGAPNGAPSEATPQVFGRQRGGRRPCGHRTRRRGGGLSWRVASHYQRAVGLALANTRIGYVGLNRSRGAVVGAGCFRPGSRTREFPRWTCAARRSTRRRSAPSRRRSFQQLNEALDERARQHITPRDVVHVIVDLLLAGDRRRCAGRRRAERLRPLQRSEHITASQTRGGEPYGRTVNRDARRPRVRSGGERGDVRQLQVLTSS